MVDVKVCTEQAAWDAHIREHGGHPLQLWGWGTLKERGAWRAARLQVVDGDKVIGAAQVLRRSLPFPFRSFLYVPRGPVCAPEDRGRVLKALRDYLKKNYSGKAVNIMIEPDWEGSMPAGSEEWKPARNKLLLGDTLVLDLTQDEETLLAAMHQKRRQDIRKFGNKGFELREVTDHAGIARCLEIYKEIADRAGFELHDDAYYYAIFDDLGEGSPVYELVDADGETVGFQFLLVTPRVAFALYGGVNAKGRKLRANGGFEWECMKLMKSQGVEQFDLNGLLNDRISDFKRYFAKHENHFVGSYALPLSVANPLWEVALPQAKKVMSKSRGLLAKVKAKVKGA